MPQNDEADATPMPETNLHPVHVALLQLEKVIGTRKHLYINRLIEGCHAPCDSLYNAWKTLYNDWECIKEQIHMKSFSEKSRLSEGIEPIVSSVLKYPVIERNQKKSRKKVDLPKHMTSSDARKILKLQEEEKRRTEIVKAAKQHQKINKRTQAPKRPHKTISKTLKSITSKDNLLSRKSSRPREAKMFDYDFTTSDESSDTEEIIIVEESESKYEEEYFCKKCEGEGSIRIETFGCSATNVNAGFMQDAQI